MPTIIVAVIIAVPCGTASSAQAVQGKSLNALKEFKRFPDNIRLMDIGSQMKGERRPFEGVHGVDYGVSLSSGHWLFVKRDATVQSVAGPNCSDTGHPLFQIAKRMVAWVDDQGGKATVSFVRPQSEILPLRQLCQG